MRALPFTSLVRVAFVVVAGLMVECAASEKRGPSGLPDRANVRKISPVDSKQTVAPSSGDACSESVRAFEQPIKVIEDLGIERRPPIVGFPIAFSRDADVHSLTGFFAATPDGEPLPTQMEVLSRWGDGTEACGAPIRWAYGWVLADVPPKAESFLLLRHLAKTGAAPSAKGSSLGIDETADSLRVDTGAARFTIRKDWFAGLALVEIGNRTISLLPTGTEAGMVVERGDDRFTPAEGKLLSLEVERKGPLYASIAVKGSYGKKGSPDIFRYTMRLHFYAGSAAVVIDHTYYNGELADRSAHGGKNRTVSDRVLLRIPLLLGSGTEVLARAATKVHRIAPQKDVAIEQHRRSPKRPEVVFSVTHGAETVELGTFADDPMLAVKSPSTGLWAIATIANLGPRDPQALRFDAQRGALEIDWQSEQLHIGGARGIWSKAVLEFGEGDADLSRRASALHAHGARPLIGAPRTAYLNTTRARGSLPERELSREYRSFDEDVDRIHDTTAGYLRKYRITGTQIWPDLPRYACRGGSCVNWEKGYFEGGDCNYWDWSTVELEQFLRSADPAFLFDFSIPEAITMAETVSFRPNQDLTPGGSSFAGFSPCYGGASGDDGIWIEGLNHRRGNCPGDYSYNKVHKLAYVLTADRRFLDFFKDGAETAIRMYHDPDKDPIDTWLELSASRTVYQYLEPLLDAAEFLKSGDAENRRYRDVAIRYFEHMRTRALERGHTCFLLGSGLDDPKKKGDCTSDQGWMTPVWLEWVVRLADLYAHAPARAWLLEFAKMSAERLTEKDDKGLPDVSKSGWRTMYRCEANASGIRDATCRRITEMENEGGFYANGLVAYLNSYGVVLDAHPEDPLSICKWLPDAYRSALRGMATETNDFVWGKELGQAYALTQTTLAAIERCASHK